MSTTQNEKIRQVTETTMVIGVDIASEVHWARAFDWRGLELGKVIHFENSAEGSNNRWFGADGALLVHAGGKPERNADETGAGQSISC